MPPEAIGSEFGGRKAGALGDVATFSFHGSKTFTTGEGGMLVTDDDELHARVMQLRDHGREPGDIHFKNTEVAFKYKMPPVAAAIGLAQVERSGRIGGPQAGDFRMVPRGTDGSGRGFYEPRTSQHEEHILDGHGSCSIRCLSGRRKN